MLDNPSEPVSDLSYFDCIESVMENSKVGRAPVRMQPVQLGGANVRSSPSLPPRSSGSLWRAFLKTARRETCQLSGSAWAWPPKPYAA